MLGKGPGCHTTVQIAAPHDPLLRITPRPQASSEIWGTCNPLAARKSNHHSIHGVEQQICSSNKYLMHIPRHDPSAHVFLGCNVSLSQRRIPRGNPQPPPQLAADAPKMAEYPFSTAHCNPIWVDAPGKPQRVWHCGSQQLKAHPEHRARAGVGLPPRPVLIHLPPLTACVPPIGIGAYVMGHV